LLFLSSLLTGSKDTIPGPDDVKNASIAQEAYYVDERTYTSDLATLTAYGFRQTQRVTVQVPSKDDNSYTLTAFHGSGDKTYTLVGPGGTVTSD